MKSGRPLYGEVGNVKDSTGRLKQITRCFRSSLDLSSFAKGPASRISRAPAIRCATKMNSENERSDSTLLRAAALPERVVTNWRRRSSGLRRGLEGDTRSAARTNRKTFSESFSKWVRNGSSLQRPSYLILFEKSHILAPKNGHEPPDSDLRLQLQIVYLSTSCRNQRRQVPVKVPVKIELAKTQQYSANTGEKRCHNSSGVPKNVV